MFEITLFFLFLIDSVQQIAKYYSEGICPVWAKYTLCARMHKNIIKIKKFSCLKLIYVYCMYFHQLRTHHAMGLVQTTNKHFWRNFGCFRVFFVPFCTVPSAFFGEGHVLGFEIVKLF